MNETITWLIALIPSVVSVAGIVASVLVCIKKIKKVVEDDEKINIDLKQQLKSVITEKIDEEKLIKELNEKVNSLNEKLQKVAESCENTLDTVVKQKDEMIASSKTIDKIKHEYQEVKAQLNHKE